jgi:ATP-dependent protease ClpP protease subunit
MTGDIQIYGGIGSERNETSFDNVKAQLDAVRSADEIALHIWSPGGDVMEGEAIYNLLKNSGKKITTYVEGTTASIATLIAGAGDRIIMNETARFMIHNPKISGLNSQADSRDLRHIANQLDKVKTLLIDVYDKKTSLGKPKLWELYDNETWYTANEAKEAGFVDEVVDAQVRAVAKIDIKHFNEMKNESLWKKIENLFQLPKFKAEFVESLEDGTSIVVMSDDEDWTGKAVIYEDGTPLPDGQYKLKSGKGFSVSGGNIAEVYTAEDAQPPQAESEPAESIESLKAKLAEALAANEVLKTQVTQSQATAQKATADKLKIENRMAVLEKDFIQLKTEASATFGDTTPPAKGPVIKNVGKQQQQPDPMGDFALQHYKNRNLIKDED